MSVVRSWKPCPAYSGSECPGKTPELESEAISVFQTGLTRSTGCVLSYNPVILPGINEPQIHTPLAELSACCARGCAGNADEYRSIAITHRKGREERKAEEEKSLRPLRLKDFHGIPMVRGNKAMVVFQTGFTGSTGCVLSFNPVIWSRMEKTQINADTLTSYEVECLLHLKDVQVTQICHYGTYHGG